MRLVGSHATQDDIDSGRSNNSFAERFGDAHFWPAQEGAPEPGVRKLNGELEIKRSLKLGFVFPRFSVRVSTFQPKTQPTLFLSILLPSPVANDMFCFNSTPILDRG